MRGLVLIALLGAALVAATSPAVKAQFASYCDKYDLAFEGEEYVTRLGNFEATLARIAEKRARGGPTEWGITIMAHLSPAEFKAKYLRAMDPVDYDKDGFVGEPINEAPLTVTSWDWRQHQPPVVTPIKNQLQCGCPSPMTAVEVLETLWALAGNTLVALSPQQVIDCDTREDGCDGGDLDIAFYYVAHNGLESNATYPYRGVDQKCRYNKAKVVATMNGWKFVTKTRNETAMQLAVINAPIGVVVDASEWQDYTGGVITPHICQRQLDHCVTLEGFNTTTTAGGAHLPYWIARNTWTTDWGIEGRIWLEFGKNTCGLGTAPIEGIMGGTASASSGEAPSNTGFPQPTSSGAAAPAY